MAKSKYSENMKGQTREFWRSLMSLEAFIGVVISAPKTAETADELYRLVHFIYWIAPPADMPFPEAVTFLQREIDNLPRAKRRTCQAAARKSIKGLTRPHIRTLIFGNRPMPAKQSAGFYQSWEWRTLRMSVLKERGRRCECCGATPADFDMTGKQVKLCVDHIKPISQHWDLRLDKNNLQVLCDECNMGKGAWDETDWRDSERMKLIADQLGEKLH